MMRGLSVHNNDELEMSALAKVERLTICELRYYFSCYSLLKDSRECRAT